jgi:alpha-beta hydrolase superfamily lysophospholipase
VKISWRAWLPDGEARAAVVIAHGISEHGGRYERVAQRLVPEGFAVYANDHRGHGRSEGRRAYLDRMDNVAADLDHMVDLATEAHAGDKPFLLGHSFGGCLATTYALARQPKLRALALSAPLLTLAAATPQQRAAGRVLSRVVPWLPLFPIDAEGVSRDPEEVRIYREDPLNHHGRLPARTVSELAEVVHTFPDRLPALTLPLLVMHGSGDRIVPDEGGKLADALASSQDKTFISYEGFFHELFNEPEPDRTRVLDDLAAWLTARA